jgi:hypothetical protein
MQNRVPRRAGKAPLAQLGKFAERTAPCNSYFVEREIEPGNLLRNYTITTTSESIKMFLLCEIHRSVLTN